MGGVAASLELAMEKLRSVYKEQKHGLAQRTVLYLAPPLGGTLTFGATLVVAQAAGVAAGISCSTPALGSLVGCMALCTASAASAQVSCSLKKLCSQEVNEKERSLLSKEDLLVNAVVGFVAFKVLGGRCRNLMPSNVINPGALARVSIPARGAKYANEVEQGLIKDLYRRHGCHHCGRRVGNCIADHIPPNVVAYGKGWAKSRSSTEVRSLLARLASTIPLPAIAPRVVQQRLYPQCTHCMKIQSAALRHGKKALVFHFRRGIPEPPYFAGLCTCAWTTK